MPFPVGVDVGIGLDTTVSPFVCTEDAVIGGGEPVFRVGKKKGISTPVRRTTKECLHLQWMPDRRLNIYARA